MKKAALILSLTVIGLALAGGPVAAKWKVTSDRAVNLGGHPESVAFWPAGKALLVSNFGPQLKPLLKDGRGYISRLNLNGRVLDKKFLPGPGLTMNKPKGVWVDGDLMWTTDIDGVWLFDLRTRKGRKLGLGAIFANDPVVGRGKLYVSDTATGKVTVITPAYFLKTRPKVTVVFIDRRRPANGLWLTPAGVLYMACYARGVPAPILKLVGPNKVQTVTGPLGRLDGLAILRDGTILYTDWAGHGLFAVKPGGKPYQLAGGFKGPADFAVIPQGKRYLVVVPDLVTGVLRFVTISR
jgi:DNA-binding beta-propeller fold protein YncE